MSEPGKLRSYAAQCLESARTATDGTARAAWLEMALSWLRMAGTANKVSQQQQEIQPEPDKN